MSTVVPTRATVRLAALMVSTARREKSGAEAVILHLDDMAPGQYAALVGILLDVASGQIISVPPRTETPTHCRDCGVAHEEEGRPPRRGLCPRCYWRHHNAGTLGQFPRQAQGRKPGPQRRLRVVS